MQLNLGCGQDYLEGWINVDVDENSSADEYYDLEDIPWPWNTNSASLVVMDNVFEHLHPQYRPAVISECHRILQYNGLLVMSVPVPEVGSGWDPSHYSIPSWRWPLHPDYRSNWTIRNVKASRVGPGRLLPEPVAILLTRFWFARCVDEVTVEAHAR